MSPSADPDGASPGRATGWLRPVQLSLAGAPGTRTTSAGPVLGVYRISGRGHRQTGVIADVRVGAGAGDRIRGHEQTRTARERALVAELDEIERTVGPAVLAHRPAAGLTAMVDHLAAAAPSATWRTDDGACHEVWIIDGEQLIPLLSACAAIDPLYIIDGHHRIAAAAQRSAARRREGDEDPTDPQNSFMAAVFPTDELAVHAYHRVVDLPAGQPPAQLLDELAWLCHVAAVDDVAAARPGAGEFGLGLAGRWYRLRPRQRAVDGVADGRTDVELLDDVILGPVIRIADPRTDERIHFVADVDEQQLIEHSRGPDRACFLVNPLTIDEVLAVADAGRTLPPKSTWFDPKPISGAVLPVRRPAVGTDEAVTAV